MRRVVQLAGRDVELSADDARRWAAIDALFAGCSESPRTPQLRLRFGRQPPELPDRPPDLSYTGIEVWLGGDGAACRSDSGVAARRHGDDITVGGPHDDRRVADPAHDPALDTAHDPALDTALDHGLDLAAAFRRSVQHVLADALAEHGRHTLHAASIRYGERIVVALGGTGAGKSTLAYAASRRGWPVLSDDLTFVACADHHILAWGLPKPLNVPGDLISGGEVIPRDARNRVRVQLEHGTAPANMAANMERAGNVAAVLLVEHANGAGRVQRIEPGPSLMKTLLPSFPLAPDPRRLRELFPIAAALSRLPAWTLHHDTDPAVRLDVAGTLLEQITEAFANDADPARGPLQ
jgi:hypothetical protein